MGREFRPLNKEEIASLEIAFKLISRISNEELPVSMPGLQDIYDTIIADDVDFPELEISLGLGFGQIFVETQRYEWVSVSFENGHETCVAPLNSKIHASPISMIQKRLDQKLNIDLGELFVETDKAVLKFIESGDYQAR